MATRREAREWAVQLLFELDVNPPDDTEEVFQNFWGQQKEDVGQRAFTEALVRGVRQHIDEIDAIVRRFAEHWDIGRMGIVERNVIRMAVYEMRFCPDVPCVVSINEAVDLAKYFSASGSGRFVNGILDRISRELPGIALQDE
jgi:N utilization substance protein B